MTEETSASAQEAPKQQFAIQRIFLKDASFESPQGAEVFKKEWKPQVNQDLNTKINKLEDNLYEVVLTLTISTKLGEDNAFLVEVQQGGIFMVAGAEGQQLAGILNTTCPNILFPYARETIDALLTKGTFPALHLPPINFDALFAQALQQAKQQQEAQGEAEATH